jgi:glycosyltransferase involved in cell wall biosynthesis
MDADIHVVHAHIPDSLAFDKTKKIIFVKHGAPEHVFEASVTAGLTGNYGASDSLAMAGYFLQRADAVVSFWPRQASIWETMTRAPVYVVPMGIDLDFWKPVAKQRLLTGTPAILTAENCHTCKWPLDLLLMWPLIVKQLPDARAHFINIPYDQHRWWMPLSYMNGARYSTYISPSKLNKEQLRNFVCAADFYYSPVQYGDFNRMSLEALACGAKIISFVGNEYAQYWIPEGDHRVQVERLMDIITGKVTERPVKQVPHIKETAIEMLKIYGGLL